MTFLRFKRWVWKEWGSGATDEELLAEHVRPHDLRHAYAEHIARATDTRIAQHLLGHANLGTTDTYLGRPRLDDMVAAVKTATYGVRTNVLGVAQLAQVPLKATTGIEPV